MLTTESFTNATKMSITYAKCLTREEDWDEWHDALVGLLTALRAWDILNEKHDFRLEPRPSMPSMTGVDRETRKFLLQHHSLQLDQWRAHEQHVTRKEEAHKKVHLWILEHVSSDILSTICMMDTCKEIYEYLKQNYAITADFREALLSEQYEKIKTRIPNADIFEWLNQWQRSVALFAKYDMLEHNLAPRDLQNALAKVDPALELVVDSCRRDRRPFIYIIREIRARLRESPPHIPKNDDGDFVLS